MDFIDLKSQYLASRELINARIQAVLDHGQYIMGPEVAELEHRLAGYTGAGHCITVSSGTEALVIALMALGIEPGDEVITTPFSFIATAEAIVLLGATPVFVDVEAGTCNLDHRLIEARITPRTRAIIPVSLYGQPADMDEINAIAERHGLAVIEDAAQSFGATYRGRKSCNLSTIGCTSFFPSKPLGCYGDGGAIFTSDDGLARAMREIRVHGQSRRYVHTRIGVGGRMDTLQCAVVLAKLDRFEWEIEQRQRAAACYDALLAELFPALLPASLAGSPAHSLDRRPVPVGCHADRSSVYAQYTLLVPQRERLQEALQAAGIPTAVHYPVPIDRQPAYARWASPDGCPVAAGLAHEVLSLPMGPYLDRPSAHRVVAALADALAQLGLGSHGASRRTGDKAA
jgi:UDP-2-acetamido-2-deoxy-ribo-hexuluronate aminotransferase